MSGDGNPYDGDFEWPTNIYREMRDMATLAFFIYDFGYLIEGARKAKKEGKPFIGLEVDDQGAIKGDHGRSFTPGEVKKIIEDNLEFLADNMKQVDFKDERLSVTLDKLQARADEFPDLERPLVLEEFDDKYQKEECVYGITRDSTNKRIALVFRGTDSLAFWKNWMSNASIFKKKIATPTLFDNVSAPMKESMPKNLFLHTGFYNYLFSETAEDPTLTKYKVMMGELKGLLKKYPDHKVYVTGHSLGGALSGMCSYFLACEEDLPKPISCINFASPRFGGEGYYETSQYLEKNKQLRMLRGVNDKDTVASAPTVGYYHGGISCTLAKPWLFIKAGPPKIEYRKQGSFFSRVRFDLSQSFWTSLNVGYDHGDYISRIELHKKNLKKLNLNELYMDEKLLGFKLETD